MVQHIDNSAAQTHHPRRIELWRWQIDYLRAVCHFLAVLQHNNIWDVMGYDDDAALTVYIWNHYQHLMTDFERLVDKAIIGREKAEHSSSPKMTAMLQRSWGRVDDPAINAALQDGAEAFRRQVCDRLLQSSNEHIFVNRCPACHQIVRTPKARLCVWCGHTWYEQAPSE